MENMSIDATKHTWSLYMHTLPKNISGYKRDKVYVGITSVPAEERWRNGHGYKTQPFWSVIEEFGWENIQHEVLYENLTEDQANELEKIVIAMHNANDEEYGFNVIKGGNSHPCPKRIAQYSLSGELLCVYESAKTAKIVNNYSSTPNSNRNTSFGYQWKYLEKEEEPPKTIPPIDPYEPCRPIMQFSPDGEYITTYPSLKEAKNKYGNIKLRKKENGSPDMFGGFQWVYADEIERVKDATKIKNLQFPVYAYNLDGTFVGEFVNNREGLNKLGCDRSEWASIPRQIFINEYNNAYKGYRWTKVKYEKLPPLIEIHYKEFPVVQLDEEYNIIDIFPNCNEAGLLFSSNVKRTSKNIRNTSGENLKRIKDGKIPHKAYGFVWFKLYQLNEVQYNIKTKSLYDKLDLYNRLLEDLERK